MKKEDSKTNTEARKPYAPGSPEMTAGIWNRRKVKGGMFLSRSDLFRTIEQAETLPRIEQLHGANYPKFFEGQQEPAEALPAEIPPAVIKIAKPRNTGKAPTSLIYLPEEYTGRPVLVLALSPEAYLLIDIAESRRRALDILKADPENYITLLEQTMAGDMINHFIKETTGADIEGSLPADLKRRTAEELEFIKEYTLPDGTKIRGPPDVIEDVKKNPEKYIELSRAQKSKTQKPRTKE